MPPKEKQRLSNSFETAKGAWDLYVLFFEQGLNLVATSGVLSYITPNKYLSATYGVALREYFINHASVNRIVDVSSFDVFRSASVYPIITVVEKKGQGDHVKVSKVSSLCSLGQMVQYNEKEYTEVPSSVMTLLPDNIWGVFLSEKMSLLPTVLKGCVRFDEIAQINATSTAAEADEYGKFFIEESDCSDLSDCLKVINTGTIDRYEVLWGRKTLVHQHKKYFSPCLPLQKAGVNDRRQAIYRSAKIVFAKIGLRAEAVLDVCGEYASVNTNCVYAPIKEYSLKYLLGLSNSRLFSEVYDIFFGSLKMSGGYLQFQAPQLRTMPIHAPNDELQKKVESIVDQILSAKKQDPAADTSELEEKIDKLVFKLYGLTDAEIAIVEGKPSASGTKGRKASAQHRNAIQQKGKKKAEEVVEDDDDGSDARD